ncbi:MAG TPA: hypothetical protein VF711_00540 [Acidimicrobiales bacterium]|jgi:hypothetical protein
MKAYEHRSIGDTAAGAAKVNLGGEVRGERFLLSFGDVLALSGDFFRPVDATDGLFGLARKAGEAGTVVDSSDEIVCALKVSTLDEAVTDSRFEPGGQFASFQFSPGADRTDVERRVRDRYLGLAAVNDDHFAAPGTSDGATNGFGSALSAYRNLHQVALDHAWRLGGRGGDLSRSMAREAAAQHYLTDAFAAGHLRTPVAAIRRYWKARYPAFWDQLRRKVGSETAAALREVSPVMRLLPRGFLDRRTLCELTIRTSQYPELSLGDLVARAFHDWDNDRGLKLRGGGVIFGDGHIDEGQTRQLALGAARAGIDDVELAFRLGASGTTRGGEALYERVRVLTGAPRGAFLAEEKLPRLSPDNPEQNWRATDIEILWDSPMVGGTGATVGDALGAMLEPGGEFIRQVEALGQGLSGVHGVFAVPLLGAWLSDRCGQAYRRGFVDPLAHDPQRALHALVGSTDPHRAPALSTGDTAGDVAAPVIPA